MRTRPMMDIVKGSLFNMLEALDGIGGNVLDLFAGSGSLGIEALSRGAAHADFVEQNREACKIIRENLHRLGFAARGQVITRSVAAFLTTTPARAPYALVFIDAPYVEPVSLNVLTLLIANDWLNDKACVCIGHHKHETLPEQYERLQRIKYRCFGASCLSIYQNLTSSIP
jgi:16S rRNA (guanine(966)-N(2))-methyltransferase RsmD